MKAALCLLFIAATFFASAAFANEVAGTAQINGFQREHVELERKLTNPSGLFGHKGATGEHRRAIEERDAIIEKELGPDGVIAVSVRQHLDDLKWSEFMPTAGKLSADVGSAFQAEKPQERSFAAQENVAYCNGGFATAVQTLDSACKLSDMMNLMKILAFPNTTTQVSGYCAKTCVAAITTFWGNSDNEFCVMSGAAPQDNNVKLLKGLSSMLAMTSLTCGPNKCFTAFHGLMMDKTCSAISYETKNYKNACNAVDGCRWEDNKYRCAMDTKAQLPKVCANPACIAGLAKVMKADPKTAPAAEMYDMFCAKSGDEYCMPMFMSMEGENSGQSAMYRMCNDNNNFQCWKKMLPFAKTQALNDAKKRFQSCAANYNYRRDKVNAWCVPSYYSAGVKMEAVQRHLNYGCARNGAGQWCIGLQLKHPDNKCGETAMKNRTCSTACDTELKGLADEYGCCLANIVQQMSSYSMPARPALPYTTAEPGSWTYPPFTVPPSENLNNLSVCPSLSNIQTLTAASNTCPIPTSVTEQNACYGENFHKAKDTFKEVCNSTFLAAYNSTPTSVADATSRAKAFCSSACYQAAKSMLDLFPRCLTRSDDSAREMVMGCSKDKVTQEYCYVQSVRLQELSCDNAYSETACKAKSQCAWVKNGNSNYYRCDANPTQAYLGQICTDCLMRMAQASTDKGMRDGVAMMCSKIGNTYCYPEVIPRFQNGEDQYGYKMSLINTVCTNSTLKRCTKTLVSKFAVQSLTSATQQLSYCLQYAYSSTTSKKRCLSSFASSFSQMKQGLARVMSMCTANTGGNYCWGYYREGAANACVTGMSGSGEGSTSCSSTCSTQLVNLSTAAGCCTGNIHRMLHGYNLKTADLPKKYASFIAYNTENMMTTKPGLSNWKNCAGIDATTWATTLQTYCKPPRGTKTVAKKKKLPIAFFKIKEDPTFKARLEEKLSQDMADALLVDREAIVNGQLVEDTTMVVQIKADSDARRMRTQAAQSSGTQFNFELQAESDAETDAVAAEFDTLATSGELLLPATTATIESECSNCMDESVLSAAAVLAPMPAPGGGAPSEEESSNLPIIIGGACAGVALVGAIVGIALKSGGNKGGAAAGSGGSNTASLSQPMQPMHSNGQPMMGGTAPARQPATQQQQYTDDML